MKSLSGSASSSSLLLLPVRLSTVGSGVFAAAGPRVWNTLPEKTTSAPSLTIFCHRLKTWLFRQSYPELILWCDISLTILNALFNLEVPTLPLRNFGNFDWLIDWLIDWSPLLSFVFAATFHHVNRSHPKSARHLVSPRNQRDARPGIADAVLALFSMRNCCLPDVGCSD